MPDTSHPNYVKKYDATPELIAQMYERTSQDLLKAKEAADRKKAWPGQVDKLLETLVSKVAALESRVAVLETGKG